MENKSYEQGFKDGYAQGIKGSQGEWVPVDKDLPKEDGEYLCTARWSKSDEFEVIQLEWGKISACALDGTLNRERDRAFGDYGFGELWGNGIDNVHYVIAWRRRPARYEPNAQ